jgi:post-segregation antitoxin (ccd killing protein)
MIKKTMTKLITLFFPRMPSDANAMGTKGNVVLYLDKELVAKSKSLGFNLSKTFENILITVKFLCRV